MVRDSPGLLPPGVLDAEQGMRLALTGGVAEQLVDRAARRRDLRCSDAHHPSRIHTHTPMTMSGMEGGGVLAGDSRPNRAGVRARRT